MPLMVQVGELKFEDDRAVGMRTYSEPMLAKVAVRMEELGEKVAAQAVRSLIYPVKPHGKAALEVALKELLGKDQDLDAVYYEAAAFCVDAILKGGR